MADGGDWDMVCALVKKYGVVPHEAQAETHCTNNTAELNTVLSHLLRQDALKLRTMLMQYETVRGSGSAVVTVPTAVSDGFAEGVQRQGGGL